MSFRAESLNSGSARSSSTFLIASCLWQAVYVTKRDELVLYLYNGPVMLFWLSCTVPWMKHLYRRNPASDLPTVHYKMAGKYFKWVNSFAFKLIIQSTFASYIFFWMRSLDSMTLCQLTQTRLHDITSSSFKMEKISRRMSSGPSTKEKKIKNLIRLKGQSIDGDPVKNELNQWNFSLVRGPWLLYANGYRYVN